MDLRRLRVGEWLIGAVGVGLFLVLFVDWYARPSVASTPEGLSAWQAFTVVDLLLALLALAAIATVPLVGRAPSPSPGIAYEALLLLGSIVGALICLVRVVDVPADGLSLRPGAWIGLALALGLCASCLVAMRDERLSDPGRLTDATGVPVDAAPVPEELSVSRA